MSFVSTPVLSSEELLDAVKRYNAGEDVDLFLVAGKAGRSTTLRRLAEDIEALNQLDDESDHYIVAMPQFYIGFGEAGPIADVLAVHRYWQEGKGDIPSSLAELLEGEEKMDDFLVQGICDRLDAAGIPDDDSLSLEEQLAEELEKREISLEAKE